MVRDNKREANKHLGGGVIQKKKEKRWGGPRITTQGWDWGRKGLDEYHGGEKA